MEPPAVHKFESNGVYFADKFQFGAENPKEPENSISAAALFKSTFIRKRRCSGMGASRFDDNGVGNCNLDYRGSTFNQHSQKFARCYEWN